MQSELIQYRGRYQYVDGSTLERALRSARDVLEDEDLLEVGAWLRFFVSRGVFLTVNLSVPDCSEHRFAAANMFLVLAHGAIEGSVAAVHGEREIDCFIAGLED